MFYPPVDEMKDHFVGMVLFEGRKLDVYRSVEKIVVKYGNRTWHERTIYHNYANDMVYIRFRYLTKVRQFIDWLLQQPPTKRGTRIIECESSE